MPASGAARFSGRAEESRSACRLRRRPPPTAIFRSHTITRKIEKAGRAEEIPEGARPGLRPARRSLPSVAPSLPASRSPRTRFFGSLRSGLGLPAFGRSARLAHRHARWARASLGPGRPLRFAPGSRLLHFAPSPALPRARPRSKFPFSRPRPPSPPDGPAIHLPNLSIICPPAGSPACGRPSVCRLPAASVFLYRLRRRASRRAVCKKPSKSHIKSTNIPPPGLVSHFHLTRFTLHTLSP